MKYLLSELLPNGKIIYYNNNTYQSNLLRLLTQSDYNELHSLIVNKTQVSYNSAYRTNSGSDSVSVSSNCGNFKVIVVSAMAYISERSDNKYGNATCILKQNDSAIMHMTATGGTLLHTFNFSTTQNTISVTYTAQNVNDSGRIDIMYATFT